MKTEYLITIVDDNKSGLDSSMKNIKRFLDKESIMLKYEPIIIANDWDIKEKRLKELMENPELDMVLVDFNLDENFKGDTVIKYIRANCANYHVPIIFYTSQDVFSLVNQVNCERAKAGQGVFEGIYYSDRENLEEKANAILGSLIKKENTVQRGRGLLLSSCSEIESKISQIFCLLKTNLKNRQCARKILIENLKKQASDSFIKELEKADENSIFDFVNSDLCSTLTHKKVKSLYKIFQMQEIKSRLGLKKIKMFGRLYYNIVKSPNSTKGLMDLRNIYGHRSKADIIPIHKPKYIRQECIAQLQNLDSIIDLLNS